MFLLLRWSIFFLALTVFPKIFNILFFGLVTRYANKKEFGALALALAFINVSRVISCLGINRILPGFIAENSEKKAFSRIRSSLVASYRLTMGVALTLSAVLFFSAEFLSELLNKPVFAGVLRQKAVIIPFATSIDMMVSCLQSFHNVWGMQFKESVQPFVRVVLTALFIMLNLSFSSIVSPIDQIRKRFLYGFLGTALLSCARKRFQVMIVSPDFLFCRLQRTY
jgi:O-antigen/teichoic acid export membrane protein